MGGAWTFWIRSDPPNAHVAIADPPGKQAPYWMTDGHELPILGCTKVGVGIVSASTQGGTTTYVTADFSGCH